MFLVRSVCLFVCLSVGLLANLWTDFDEIFWRGRAWLKDQVIQFWWQSGSRFESGSPKSEIRILQIGGGLCSLSASSYCYFRARAYIAFCSYFSLFSLFILVRYIKVTFVNFWALSKYLVSCRGGQTDGQTIKTYRLTETPMTLCISVVP